MLEINVKADKKEAFDDAKGEFVNFVLEHDYKLMLEHSLVSISKWESKWHKPFLSNNKKTDEEILDYIRCMIVTPNVPDDAVYFMTKDDLKKINEYIEDPMTATTFHTYTNPNNPGSSNRKMETMTSEIIYYQMIQNEIPYEFQKWHLNRLLTLIRVCNIKNNSNNNKMSKKDALAQNRSINQARRSAHGAK